MPTLVDDSAALAAAGDVDMMDETVATPPPPASSGKGKSGKRRAMSPTPDAAATANQAIAAANLAAAVQMAASLQLNGLLSLLTQSSTPGAASAADPTVLQATAPKANTAWQIPTPEQARQAAIKAATDTPPFVHLSKTDSAPQLKILDDRLTLKGGMRGYRMSRATHGVSEGFYYYEVLVLDPPSIHEIVNNLPPNARLGSTLQKQVQEALEYEKRKHNKSNTSTTTTTASSDAATTATSNNEEPQPQPNKPGRKRKADTESSPANTAPPQVGGHLRIGWSMRTGDLQAPVGYDKWSYGFRNLAGSKIHQSRRDDHWGGEPWGPGDVVGFAIFLEGSTNVAAAAAAAATGPTPASPAATTSATATLTPATVTTTTTTTTTGSSTTSTTTTGNQIRFFKNGAAMGQFIISKGKREGGAAFEDIQPGTYYPAISSYLGGSVQVNFGPHFVYPPRKLPHGMSGKLQPISSLARPPLTESELLARLKKKNIFTKMGKEAPETKMAAFREAALEECKVLQESYQQHRRKHLQFVMEARQARHLSIADLQQELKELEERSNNKKKDDGDKDKSSSSSTTVEKTDAAAAAVAAAPPTSETKKEPPTEAAKTSDEDGSKMDTTS